jgi:hypothetical protein
MVVLLQATSILPAHKRDRSSALLRARPFGYGFHQFPHAKCEFFERFCWMA